LWSVECLPEFVAAREQMIRRRVVSVTNDTLPAMRPFAEATSA
jgi:hypothetical protein